MIWNQADTWDDPVSLITPIAPEVSIVTINGQKQVTWNVIKGLNYQLRRSSNLVTWEDDNRTIISNGNTRYFLLTQSDIDQRLFFNLTVTAE